MVWQEIFQILPIEQNAQGCCCPVGGNDQPLFLAQFHAKTYFAILYVSNVIP
jgi:hypothetical protein